MIKQKQDFINTLSHDLRVSAIAQIRGLELLQKEATHIELVNDISDSCKFSYDMINMLLNTYQYENGEDILKYEHFNFYEILQISCKILQKEAYFKDIKILYNKKKNTKFIQAEKNGLTKVVTTLLSTAIHNSCSNSNIYITTEQNNKTLSVSIVYEGKGLTEEECRRMFLHNPRFSTVGHGIKMHLIKKIIDFHKGKISVKNLANNINSFTFTIPIKKKEFSTKACLLSTLQPNKL